MPHRFTVGQLVLLRGHPEAPRGAYEVVRRMPEAAGGEFEYQIKSHTEPNIRVAKEGDLSEA